MANGAQPQAAAPQGAPGGGGGGVSDLVAGISDGMTQLQAMMAQAPQVPDETKQEMAALVQQFQDFIGRLSRGPSQAGPQPQAAGQVPAEAGTGAVEQAPPG